MTDPGDQVPDDAREFEAGVEPFWDTKPWRRKFIDTLSTTGNVSLACKEGEISRWTAYHDRRTDDGFKQAWARALAEAADLLEQIAFRRATGYKRTTEKYEVNEKGEKVLVEVKIEDAVSDNVLLTLLRAAKPEKYSEKVRMEHSGIGGDPIQIEPVRVRTPERLAELLDIARELQAAQQPAVIEHKQIEPGTNGDAPPQ